MDRFISVCVLSYNRLAFIKETLDTMVNTANEPLEIIVHDDGSAQEVTDHLAVRLERGEISRLILNPPGHNEGQGIALNRMFSMARGDIIVKADHDLLYKPGWTTAVRRILEASAEHSRYDAEPRVGALGLFKYHTEPVRCEDMYLHSILTEGGVEWDVCSDFVGSLIAMPRAAWARFGPFEERSPAFAEDAVMKQQINASQNWCCALSPEDYVENVGFGVGPSTLVEGFKDGVGIIHEINTGPRLVTGTEVVPV